MPTLDEKKEEQKQPSFDLLKKGQPSVGAMMRRGQPDAERVLNERQPSLYEQDEDVYSSQSSEEEDSQDDEYDDGAEDESGDYDDTETYDGEEGGGVQSSGPRFGFADALLFISLCGLKDIFDTTWIGGVLIGGAIFLILRLKGVKLTSKKIIALLIDFIPFLGVLPITLLTGIITVWTTNHPKMVGAAVKRARKLK